MSSLVAKATSSAAPHGREMGHADDPVPARGWLHNINTHTIQTRSTLAQPTILAHTGCNLVAPAIPLSSA